MSSSFPAGKNSTPAPRPRSSSLRPDSLPERNRELGRLSGRLLFDLFSRSIVSAMGPALLLSIGLGVIAIVGSLPSADECTLAEGKLLAAIEADDVGAAREAMLNLGARPPRWMLPRRFRFYKHSWTIEAVRSGSDEVLAMLLGAGMEPNPVTLHLERGTALEAAAEMGSLRMINLLISNGASPELGNPLGAAAAAGNVEIVRRLLTAGAHFNEGPGEDCERGALVLAVKADSLEAAEVLIGAGADVNACIVTGQSPLRFATSKAMRTLLTRAGGVSGHTTPLMDAARSGDLRLARVQLSEMKHPVHDAGRALLDAIAKNHTEMVELLLEFAAADGRPGRTRPLTFATRLDRSDIAGQLLQRGAKVEYEDVAAAVRSRAMIETYMDNGLGVNDPFSGRTPVVFAAMQGHWDVVEFLYKRGATLHTKRGALRIRGQSIAIMLNKHREAERKARWNRYDYQPDPGVLWGVAILSAVAGLVFPRSLGMFARRSASPSILPHTVLARLATYTIAFVVAYFGLGALFIATFDKFASSGTWFLSVASVSLAGSSVIGAIAMRYWVLVFAVALAICLANFTLAYAVANSGYPGVP